MIDVTLTLDWKVNTMHAGFYIAKQKGYYEVLGLRVEIFGEAEGKTLDSGSDFICAPQASYLLGLKSETTKNLTAIATVTQVNDSGIVSLAQQNITSPKKLMGKRLTHWNQEWFHKVLNQVIVADGGNYSDVNLIPMDVDDITTTLETVADATWVYKSWEYFELLNAGKQVEYFAFAELDPVFNYCSPAVFVQNSLKNNSPEVVKSFLQASEKGYIEAAMNPETAVNILAPLRPDASEQLIMQSQQHISKLYLDKYKNWGRIDAVRWNNFTHWMYQQKLMNQDISLHSGGFTNEYFQ